jgi:hypothetical protein
VSSSPSSLVLGAATGLAPATIEPFVESLRRTGYHGRVGLILAGYDREDLQKLRAMVDLTWVVDDQYHDRVARILSRPLDGVRQTRFQHSLYPAAFMLCTRLCRERNACTRWQNLEFLLEGLYVLRYQHYYDAVRETADADEILLADVRDVLFQTDPFEEPLGGLETFAEDAAQRIGSERWNREWIRTLYGPKVLRRMADDVVSCSGTVIGTRAELLHYLKEMQVAISWRRRPFYGDQGIHNYLLRSGRLAPAKLVANGEGRVLTMGAMTRIERDGVGRVVNLDGTVPAVLHQYDRHPALAPQLQALLAGRSPATRVA